MKLLAEKIDRLANLQKELGIIKKYPFLEIELKKIIVANCEELEEEIRLMYEKMDRESEEMF